MWVCFKCGQEIEDEFDACWNCAAPPDQRLGPPIAPWQWRKAFAIGLLFEVILVSLCALLPGNSWLLLQASKFLMFSHRPLLWLLSLTPGPKVIIVLSGGLVMALVWAFLFRQVWVLANRALSRFAISRRHALR